jgi:hypothetical protein
MTRTTVLVIIGACLAAWAAVAYVAMPFWWKRYVNRHPALDGVASITQTASGIPGDPVNVALAGTEAQVRAAFAAAKWSPADALSLESDVRIAADAVLERPYAGAPVSNLYLFGRKEDLAFEMAAGASPRERHHVRFWRAPADQTPGVALWVGSASFDRSVGLSHTTGQITHHIAPDVDAERDHVMKSLDSAGWLSEVTPVAGFHAVREGRNGGGDPWRTDGTLLLGVISN